MAVLCPPSTAAVDSLFAPAVWWEPVVYAATEPAPPAPVDAGPLRAINPSALGPSSMNPAM